MSGIVTTTTYLNEDSPIEAYQKTFPNHSAPTIVARVGMGSLHLTIPQAIRLVGAIDAAITLTDQEVPA